MKSFLNRIALVLVVVSLASVAAFAKTQTRTVNFRNDVNVNGTQVSKGVYELKFDDKTGEVSVIKRGKVIARTPGTMEKRTSKARNFELRFNGKGNEAQLSGVTFAGSQHDIVIDSRAASR